MENYETLKSFTEGITHFENLFRINPKAIACDLHPDYLSTRYALERSLTSQIPFFQIQHHHAHIASCMVDNGLNGDLPVIGVSFDGTGLGTDGAIWGGEFLIADYKGFQRVAHLEYSPLPGGDAATKNPYRIALAQLWRHHIDWDPSLFPFQASCGDDLTMLRSMLENRINTPLTSSVGRLFDSVSALIGVRSEINYEAQAAIELENIVDSEEENSYPFDLLFATDRNAPSTELPAPLILSTKSLFETILQDIQEGIKTPIIAARFHNGLAKAATEICHLLREMYGINEVALSGGVWQNMVLLKQTYRLLTEDKFIVYTHRQVPTNDGGLALGQAVIASCKL
jgi:hydrogenase maturation protein HypF